MKLLTLLFASILAAQQKPDIRVDVDLVTVACSVTDHGGAPVKTTSSKNATNSWLAPSPETYFARQK
jgi:hypothetical protein